MGTGCAAVLPGAGDGVGGGRGGGGAVRDAEGGAAAGVAADRVRGIHGVLVRARESHHLPHHLPPAPRLGPPLQDLHQEQVHTHTHTLAIAFSHALFLVSCICISQTKPRLRSFAQIYLSNLIQQCFPLIFLIVAALFCAAVPGLPARARSLSQWCRVVWCAPVD